MWYERQSASDGGTPSASTAFNGTLPLADAATVAQTFRVYFPVIDNADRRGEQAPGSLSASLSPRSSFKLTFLVSRL